MKIKIAVILIEMMYIYKINSAQHISLCIYLEIDLFFTALQANVGYKLYKKNVAIKI